MQDVRLVPVSLHPIHNPSNKPNIDAFHAQLSDHDNAKHPILFISRTLRPAEHSYTSTEIECLAVVWDLQKLQHYLDGSTFTLVTDHNAIKWIWSLKFVQGCPLSVRACGSPEPHLHL
jgi:hypothetical protein